MSRPRARAVSVTDAPRTPDEEAHEKLGLELGRVCAADPRFHELVLRGFARARAEAEAGRRPNASRGGLELAGAKLAEIAGVPFEREKPKPKPKARRRPRGRR